MLSLNKREAIYNHEASFYLDNQSASMRPGLLGLQFHAWNRQATEMSMCPGWEMRGFASLRYGAEFKYFFFLTMCLFYEYECLFARKCVDRMCAVPTEARESIIPLELELRVNGSLPM